MEIKANKRKNKYWKVTQEVLDKILVRLKNGSTRKHAAECNGVSRRHFHNIMAQGIIEIEEGIFDSIAARLVLSVREIESNEIENCRQLTRVNEKGHHGAEWTLEHAYWRDFSKDSPAKELAEEIAQLRQEIKGVKNNGEVDDSETEEDS